VGRSNLKLHTEPGTRDYHVVPFDNHRRRLHVASSAAGEIHPLGVVIPLPLPVGSSALQRTTEAPTSPSDSNGDRFTVTDGIVAFFLFLSTLTAPALAWTLLSF
jgi:hypothetical protein